MSSDDPNTVRIRSTTRADWSSVVEFLRPFVTEGRLLPRTEQEAEDLLEHGFVAELAGRVVGFATLEIYSPKMAEIRSLAVASQLQGTGVGKKLVAACVQCAQTHKVREVMAITSQEGFFMSCGFHFALPGERKALFLETRGAE